MLEWIKAFHIVFVITWFAGLFYLPRLFVYHAMATDRISMDRFKVMERKLFYGIMTPSAVLAVGFGAWLWLRYDISGTWLHVKLALVLVLLAYHGYCTKLMLDFKHDRNPHGHVFYRWLNELPVIVLIAVVILAVVKPL
ncbi:MAG: protoporphyrinogen oxidase HemJ [Acidiferrobacterales bacterium]